MEAGVERSRSLVLRSGGLEDARNLAERNGWQRVDSGERDAWALWRIGDRAYFCYALAQACGERVCYFYGPDKREVDALFDRYADGVDAWTLDELLVRSPDEPASPATRLREVLRLGLGAPRECSLPFLRYLWIASRHDNEIVRGAVPQAAFYMRWPALRRLLRDLSRLDRSPRVRELARLVLEEINRRPRF